MRKALLVIDLQNDYFPGGSFPLWNTSNVLVNIKDAIKKAKYKNIPIILIQHVCPKEDGKALFFNENSDGVNIHNEILEAVSQAPVVIKKEADAFYNTELEDVLTGIDASELLICGMMTQNCVTHTAMSKSAEKYKVTVLGDCCTTVNEVVHLMALRALRTRVTVKNYEEVLK